MTKLWNFETFITAYNKFRTTDVMKTLACTIAQKLFTKLAMLDCL